MLLLAYVYQGSTLVTPCPIDSMANAEACGVSFTGKADGDKCPQIMCPKARDSAAIGLRV